jgi:hypothetical protein
MPTDEQMNNIVDTWLESTNDSPHSAPLTVARVMARVPQTRQRRTWWPPFLRGRRAASAPDTSDTEAGPVPSAAVSGRSPTLTRSTRSMLSPAKIIAGGAALALVSALVIVQPFDRKDDTAPAIQIPATEAGPLAAARQLHTATALGDGRVLVIGGKTPADGANTSAIAAAEMWDPATGEFEPAGSIAEARYGHTATLLPDGRILVVGGYGDDATWLDSAEVWDPMTGEFGSAGSLGVGRHAHSATLLPDGRVLVVGGYGGEWEWLTSAEIWDPETGSFAPTGELVEARWEHDAVPLPDGRVLVVGGAETIHPRTLVEIWDPETGTFMPAGELEQGRTEHATTVLTDGRVLVAGGAPGGDPWEVASVEVWDPVTNSVTASGPLEYARTSHSATLLPTGNVLIVGGTNSNGTEMPAELWDQETGSFGEADIFTDQYGHTANLLPDGRVLIVGGLVTDQESSSAAELIDPAAGIE